MSDFLTLQVEPELYHNETLLSLSIIIVTKCGQNNMTAFMSDLRKTTNLSQAVFKPRTRFIHFYFLIRQYARFYVLTVDIVSSY